MTDPRTGLELLTTTPVRMRPTETLPPAVREIAPPTTLRESTASWSASVIVRFSPGLITVPVMLSTFVLTLDDR